MEDSRQSYVFYIPWLDTIKKSVPPEHQFECIEAITRYAQTGREPEGLSAYASIVLGMAIPQIDANTKRYMDGCKGGRPRKNTPKEEIEEEKKGGFETENHSFEIENHTFECEKPYFEGQKSNDNVNDNENVNVNDNENVVRETRARAKTTRFIPPTVEEVAEYCRERGNKVDPQRFVDYYTSNGWQVGKNKMKDWKAAIRSTWERDERTQTAPVNAPRAKPRPSEEWERSDDAYTDLDAMFTNALISKHRGSGNG